MHKFQNKPRKDACAERRSASAGRGAASPFGYWNLEFYWNLNIGIWNFSLARLLLLAFLALLPATTARAQYETQLMTLVDKTPIVLEAPYPFVDATRLLPDLFAQRRAAIAGKFRLIAWFVPRISAKELLEEKSGRFRSLQVQVEKTTEQVRYDPASFAALRAKLLREIPNLPVITEDDTDTLFNLKDLSRLEKEAGGQRPLGIAELGPDSFTLCVAQSAEGRDQRGGREVEATVTCVTQMLLNEKAIILVASGPEVSAKELRNTMRLTREWIQLLRAANNAK